MKPQHVGALLFWVNLTGGLYCLLRAAWAADRRLSVFAVSMLGVAGLLLWGLLTTEEQP